MTLIELIINTLEEDSENLLDKELAYYLKDNKSSKNIRPIHTAIKQMPSM